MVNVTLLDGIFKESQEKGMEYLIYLDVDRLVAPCYEAAGEIPKKTTYGGWETRGIRGHSIGHWLSAASTMYSVTKDERLIEKLAYSIDELAHIQSFDKDGYVSGFPRVCFDNVFSGSFEVDHFSLGGSWVPWYSIHKIYAGLIDAYQLTGNQKALTVVRKLADWASEGLSQLNEEQFQKMLICEHGGMNEVFVDLYKITENDAYLELAKRFCHKAVLDPLARGIDNLAGKHANTQIPKVIGAAKLYEVTGEKQYKHIAEFFWNQVTKHRSYVIGGNSIGEHFGPEDKEELGVTTTETCNTYNMLKLTECLFRINQKVEYIDYYERALYNHILASQDPDTGMKTYFVSTQPGHFKVYCTPDQSFWCCTGTGMENPARYTKNIYYQNGDELFVNLFIASQISLEEKKMSVKQLTVFPESDRTQLIVEQAENVHLTFQIRVPNWISGPVTVTVNQKDKHTSTKNGYITLEGKWNKGDIIDIKVPMEVYSSPMKQDPIKAAILYGPIVLAGALGTEKFPETDILDDHLKLNNHPLIEVPDLITDDMNVRNWVKPVEGEPLTFKTNSIGQPGNKQVTLIPFYKLHHQRYTLYWNIMSHSKYQSFLTEKKEKIDILNRITIDAVKPNEQQPEVEHSIKKQNSRSGYVNLYNCGWRESLNKGFFSYEMKVLNDTQMYVFVTYNGDDTDRHIDGKMYVREFDIFIDDTVIAHQVLKKNKPGELFSVCYEIPMSLTNGKEKVEVKFASEENKIAGGVYEIRIVNTNTIFQEN
ncbi:glycoside hydrolase family 127 protein [Bacillus sp. J37]|uniref:glycoside hydrolase family 127 protein n=1 Tax=Bacillus sp. J37 TaxID=935837 RepID=UPI00047E2007|nr:glycoside hydrolase family 127 protein [Bacillus sp. J37]